MILVLWIYFDGKVEEKMIIEKTRGMNGKHVSFSFLEVRFYFWTGIYLVFENNTVIKYLSLLCVHKCDAKYE